MAKKNIKEPNCQRCLQKGHWSFECANPRAYTYRPSATMKYFNPSLKHKSILPDAFSSGSSEEEVKNSVEAEDKVAKKNKKISPKRSRSRSRSSSSSGSRSSSSYSSSGSRSSSYSSSDL